MRPIDGPEDENHALDIFCFALYDDPEVFAQLVPSEITPKPIAIAIAGSAIEIPLYAYDLGSWTIETTPLRYIVPSEEAGADAAFTSAPIL